MAEMMRRGVMPRSPFVLLASPGWPPAWRPDHAHESIGHVKRWMTPISWLLFTAAGVIGYRRFRRHRFADPALWLAVYSTSGFVSLLHFVDITPSELTPLGPDLVRLVDLLAVELGTEELRAAARGRSDRHSRRSRQQATSGGRSSPHPRNPRGASRRLTVSRLRGGP